MLLCRWKMSRIRVTTESLSSDKQTIRAQVRTMKTQISLLRRDIIELNAMWEGEAKTLFVKTAREDVKELAEAVKELEALVEYEDNALTQYERCEKDVAAYVSQLSI